MPCTDGGVPWRGRDVTPSMSAFDRAEILEQRNQELAAELCKTQRLVHLLRTSDLIVPERPIPIATQLDDVLRAYAKHREHDKQEELKQAKAARGKLETTIQKITALGGVPGAELQAQYVQAVNYVNQVDASDPLDTLLY